MTSCVFHRLLLLEEQIRISRPMLSQIEENNTNWQDEIRSSKR